MNTRPAIVTLPVATLALTSAVVATDPLYLDFQDGPGSWRIVLDGVMGGLSTGRVGLAQPGVLQFSGELSLENNGGFSQMRTSVIGAQFEDTRGIEITVRGDGRPYKFDIRCSNVRMMAGGFQQDFETAEGEWRTIRLPFEDFRLYSFGRLVADAPALDPARIESIGVTLADKKAGPFRLEVGAIRAFGGETARPANSEGNDLASVARAAGLDTLLELVVAAGLELPADERVTIFAPTDDAFAALPEETVERLLTPEGLPTLRAILTYHVAVPPLASSDLLARRSVPTLNGQRLPIDTSGSIMIGSAGVVAVDVPFDQGVVHVIDGVLMPQLDSIGERAAGTPDLSTLAAAVSAAGLERQLGSENGPWTVFAPVNSAFERLPGGTLESLLQPENRSALVDILGLHVVPGRLYANELLASRGTRTLLGASIEFSLDSGRLSVNDAAIVSADLEAGNGVIHLIDGVLLPSTSSDSERMAGDSVATAMHLCELAIHHGAPLYNAGQRRACAAIYEVAIEAMVGFGDGQLSPQVLDRLRLALAEAEADDSWTDRAWTYRRALDDTYSRLAHEARRMQGLASR